MHAALISAGFGVTNVICLRWFLPYPRSVCVSVCKTSFYLFGMLGLHSTGVSDNWCHNRITKHPDCCSVLFQDCGSECVEHLAYEASGVTSAKESLHLTFMPDNLRP